MARLELPDNEDHLALSLDSELTQSESEMNLNLTSWRIIDGYLRGARKFNVLDRFQGRVLIGYEHLRGDVLYRHEDIVRRYLIEVGRWLRSDLSPSVKRRGESLGDMRNAAIANAVLQARMAGIDANRLRTQLIIPYIKYGLVGIAHHETTDALHPDHIEVVTSRQLRGIPAFTEGYESLQGIARARWVPYDWIRTKVKDLYSVDLDDFEIETDLRGRRVAWGHSPPGNSVGYEGIGPSLGFLQDPANKIEPLETTIGKVTRTEFDKDINREGRYFVKMEEVYPYADDSMYAARFILKIGRKVIFQEDYEKINQRVICPLQVARYTDTGSFFSRGFVAPLIPANDQFEKVIASVARNLREMDMFGTLFVSGGMGVDLKSWNKPGPRPKVDKYNVDPLAPNAQPITLTPSNMGLMPVKFAEFMKSVTEGIAGQGPFYDGQAAGRMDSAAGHGFLFNAGNVGLGLPSHNLADCLSAIYSRVLQVSRSSLRAGETIKLATIDENLAGVVFDPETGRASLAQNPVPNPWEVRVDVKDRTPSDPDLRKRELLELFQGGLLGSTPEEAFTQYWITVFEENLDVIGGPKDIFETWRKVIWQIILLFNDGETPGPVEFGEHTQNPRVQLLALQRFMNKIEFSLASDEVQREFELWKETLERMTGVFPLGMPPPEDAAQMAMPQIEQNMAMQQQGGMGKGSADMQLAAMGSRGPF